MRHKHAATRWRVRTAITTAVVMSIIGCSAATRGKEASMPDSSAEVQLTSDPVGHILTNIGVWSPDSKWIVYDERPDAMGAEFNGSRICRVNVRTREVQVLYTSGSGAHCGVVTHSPIDQRVVFIHGPENPTDDWQYGAWHRRGSIVDATRPGIATTLDARDITEPFTPGALRGGTHVHTFSGDGQWVSFTYEDHVLATLGETGPHEKNQRNVGVSVPIAAVTVARDHPRNRDGSHYTVLVTRTVDEPRPGSDEISRAFSDAWVGTDGYVRRDGTRQKRSIAFQGHVRTKEGKTISEVFIVDLPEDLTQVGEGPLEGTATTRPCPPKGVIQRRLTYTADRDYPGLDGPRHWLRSSPDGLRIAFLMRDDDGVVQLWSVSPNGGRITKVTRGEQDIESAFSWSPDGKWIAHAMDHAICATEVQTGRTIQLTEKFDEQHAIRPLACVFSPDGTMIAYVRAQPAADGTIYNQVFAVEAPADD